MKITCGRSCIKVLTDEGKEIIIQGELTLTPKFYADFSSINKWESPFENEVFSEQMKKKLAYQIINESLSTEVPVVFEDLIDV